MKKLVEVGPKHDLSKCMKQRRNLQRIALTFSCMYVQCTVVCISELQWPSESMAILRLLHCSLLME